MSQGSWTAELGQLINVQLESGENDAESDRDKIAERIFSMRGTSSQACFLHRGLGAGFTMLRGPVRHTHTTAVKLALPATSRT